jgi:hypothetical protein
MASQKILGMQADAHKEGVDLAEEARKQAATAAFEKSERARFWAEYDTAHVK